MAKGYFAKPGEVQVARALLSVSDKTGIVEFARGLSELGIEIVSTGGTAQELEEAGIEVADEREAVIVDLHNKPGAMGEVARDLAEAGVNVDVAYTIFTGVRLVILTEDVEAARRALDLDGAAG